MIIKKIIIENYLCYFGVKEFELSNGLNIILGENGEGKTKFFEALEWLFYGDSRNLESLVSAKAIAEGEVNSQFRVRVSILVAQFDVSNSISKSFLVRKKSKSEINISNFSTEGIEENKAGERNQIDGQQLLERVFPVAIRRYSMFKGEAGLHIFDNEDALMILINSSSAFTKYYEKYASKGAFLREKAEKAVDDSAKADKKNQIEYKRLEADITKLSHDLSAATQFLANTDDQIRKTEVNIQDAEKYVNNAEALETINGRIKTIEEQIRNTTQVIDEKYTTCLFDDLWILDKFENFHHEFAEKVTSLSNRRRELQSEFDKKAGREQLKSELLNSVIPLPTGVPSKAHMEEMLKDEICKVCNRPAKKDSEPYKFMKERLEEYLKSQQPESNGESKKGQIFENN
jgi:DNA sulfur modification protein DndD